MEPISLMSLNDDELAETMNLNRVRMKDCNKMINFMWSGLRV